MRRLIVTLVVSVCVLLGNAIPAAAAPSQTVWLGRTSVTANDCFLAYYVGWITFCRWPGGATSWLNGAQIRDSNLRSSVSGIFQDKYTDNFIVGNNVGASANTRWVKNRFSAAGGAITVFTGTCYTGAGAWIDPGFDYPNPNGAGLMSFKAPFSPGC